MQKDERLMRPPRESSRGRTLLAGRGLGSCTGREKSLSRRTSWACARLDQVLAYLDPGHVLLDWYFLSMDQELFGLSFDAAIRSGNKNLLKVLSQRLEVAFDPDFFEHCGYRLPDQPLWALFEAADAMLLAGRAIFLIGGLSCRFCFCHVRFPFFVRKARLRDTDTLSLSAKCSWMASTSVVARRRFRLCRPSTVVTRAMTTSCSHEPMVVPLQEVHTHVPPNTHSATATVTNGFFAGRPFLAQARRTKGTFSPRSEPRPTEVRFRSV